MSSREKNRKKNVPYLALTYILQQKKQMNKLQIQICDSVILSRHS